MLIFICYFLVFLLFSSHSSS